MTVFFNALGHALAKAAVWCVEHPDQVIAIANAAKAARK